MEPTPQPRRRLPILWAINNVIAMVAAFNLVFALLWQPYLDPIQYAVNLLLIIPLAAALIFAGVQWGALKIMNAQVSRGRWFLLTAAAIFLMPLVENLITAGAVVEPFSVLFVPDGFSGVSRIAVAFLFSANLPLSLLLSAFAGLFTGAANGLVLGGFQALALGERRTGLRWLAGTVIAFAVATTVNSAVYAAWIYTYQTEEFPYLPALTALLGLLYAVVTWGVLRGLVERK